MVAGKLDRVTRSRVEMLLRSGWKLTVELRGDVGGNGYGGMQYKARFVRYDYVRSFRQRQVVAKFTGYGATYDEAIEHAAWQTK